MSLVVISLATVLKVVSYVYYRFWLVKTDGWKPETRQEVIKYKTKQDEDARSI